MSEARGTHLFWLLPIAALGCIGSTGDDEVATASVAPIDTQASWKTPGAACTAGFVQLGVDPVVQPGTDAGRLAVCVQQDFCAARPSVGGYCASAPKSVLTTDPATFWSELLIDCPAVGRMAQGALTGTAEIRVPDAGAPGGARVFALDAGDVHTRIGSDGGWEPCLTNPAGIGMRDPTCDAGIGTMCSIDGDAVVECVSTWVDDRRSGQSVRVQRVEALSRRTCTSGICEEGAEWPASCQEDRALKPLRGDMECGAGRRLVDGMCLTDAFCAARAPGLYCNDAPAGVSDTRAWGDRDAYDSIAPGALVIAGHAAVQCGRDWAGRATTTLFPCTSGTCVGNGAGFGCVDGSCEARNSEIDLETLYWSGTPEHIAAIEGKYCSGQRPNTLLDCELVQVYDATLDSFLIRLLPEKQWPCSGWAPICEEREPGVADACVPSGAL
ncbi:MAG: hypothetical protein HYY06_22880 [Deltaproteobacteria bacterium]|nr:hypothetical protein [Deltaproteobacteria bacterium]